MMRLELLYLSEQVMKAKGWGPSLLERRFGSPKILHTIQYGKNGPTLALAERFKTWCQSQLQDTAD